jgi:tRNA-specific 2-thiouridylase
VDLGGRTLGTHRGILHYTVGQRRGLGIAAGEPLYVVSIDPGANTVALGPRRALESPGLETGPANWLGPSPVAAGTRAEVQIRYRHRPAPARLYPREDGGVTVRFEAPQAAITPGQICAFYDGDRVLGGAEIARAAAGHSSDGVPTPAREPVPL